MIQAQQYPEKRKRPTNSRQGRLLHHSSSFALLVALTMLVVACSSSQPPAGTANQPAGPAGQPASPSAPKDQGKPGAPATVQAKPAPPAYVYDSAGRRDPFSPIVEREVKQEQKFGLPPLERYPVTEFKLKGIVWGGFGYSVMLEGPDGKGYFAREGTIIGPNRGKISKITKDSFTVLESFKNTAGAAERKEITVKLQVKQEGLP